MPKRRSMRGTVPLGYPMRRRRWFLKRFLMLQLEQGYYPPPRLAPIRWTVQAERQSLQGKRMPRPWWRR